MNVKKLTNETLIAVGFTAWIMVCMLGIIWIIPKWFYQRYSTVKTVEQQTDYFIDWEEKYPFLEKENRKVEMSYIDNCEQKIKSIEERIETKVNANLPLGYPLAELYARIQKMLGTRMITSKDADVFMLDDGYFAYQNDEQDTNAVAVKIGAFRQKLQESGIEFLYVMAPYKAGETDEKNLFYGYEDYMRVNAEKLDENLTDAEIPLLNLQKRAEEEGREIMPMMFRTDHHWKPESALWGAKEIAEELNERYGFSIDVSAYDEKYFRETNYKESFLGSQEKGDIGIL